jgi:DNA-directed RNA polymerase subunit L
MIKGKQFGQSFGEGINLEALPSISNGKFNATFIPVSQCSYIYTPDKNPDRIAEVFKKWLSSSKNIKEDEIKEDDARRVALEKEFNTMEVGRCYLEDERGEPYSYDFTVETVGVLSIGYIIRRACEIGEAMCMRFASIDESDLPEDLTMQRTTAAMAGYDFFFKAQDHTLGNMLQTYIVENHIEDEANELSSVINYAGYCVPHPLHDVMKLTIGTLDDQEVSARKCIAAAARGCAGIFRQLRADWMKAISERGSR